MSEFYRAIVDDDNYWIVEETKKHIGNDPLNEWLNAEERYLVCYTKTKPEAKQQIINIFNERINTANRIIGELS